MSDKKKTVVKKTHDLNLQQKKFADLYIKNGNAYQCYSEVYGGTSREVIDSAASRLLRNVKIKDYIAEMTAKIEKKSGKILSMTEIKEYWSNIMNNDATGKQGGLKASEYLAKSGGGFLDRVEVSGSLSVNVEVVGSDVKD